MLYSLSVRACTLRLCVYTCAHPVVLCPSQAPQSLQSLGDFAALAWALSADTGTLLQQRLPALSVYLISLGLPASGELFPAAWLVWTSSSELLCHPWAAVIPSPVTSQYPLWGVTPHPLKSVLPRVPCLS